mgnify:CR=1 FL=1
MALNIINIRLNEEQEESILQGGREEGYVMLILKENGSIRLSQSEEEILEEDDTDATTVDFTSEYYENVLGWMEENDFEITDDVMDAIGEVRDSEVEFEEQAYNEAVKKAGTAVLNTANDIKARVEEEMKGNISTKQKNDYRAVLKHIEKGDYDPEYVKKWSARLLGQDRSEELEHDIGSAESEFADKVLKFRMYNRIFVDDGAIVEGNEELKWIRLEGPSK